MPDVLAGRGALNLLRNCARARPGERLLIAYEPPEYGYFDDRVVALVGDTARSLGLSVELADVGFNPDDPHLTPGFLRQCEDADIIVFFARLGDQLRFSDMPPGKRVIVSFALSRDLLGSGFATSHHAAFVALKDAVNSCLARAREVRITCRAGTDITGHPEMDLSPSDDTSVLRFPMSVFAPVPAHGFSGRAALSGFLTGTGSRYYDNYTVEFDGPVHALMNSGRLTGFQGGAGDVARANAHYDHVAGRYGIDRNFVHSWHAGIHPGCGYPWPARDSYERWSGAAFGNPRILHFHTCGAYAPGEISWNVIDPTIEADGVTLWEAGRFHAERVPGAAAILRRYPCAGALFAQPDRNIGLPCADPLPAPGI
ncbi:hypothetical protein [Pukyongiella litopenaei]|uniref:Uncharacterized protein n=1 Tax=Pukyongiella litopenaei TaxID=2605946 RepID=A0A2S0MKB0_9RHOB|nr:hypothetical protein [Pukyongiella litopenaei]AVO36310.1 hypothetical protein C6Y53_00355 [Pukyongiella litopenaei]